MKAFRVQNANFLNISTCPLLFNKRAGSMDMTNANNKQGTSDPLFYTKLYSQRCF